MTSLTTSLSCTAFKTRIFNPGENLSAFIKENISSAQVRNGMVLAVTSKIVSLSENRLVARSSIDKDRLVLREADHDLGKIAHGYRLTIKDGHLIPSAGIDESNSVNGDYILYPEDCFESAYQLWRALRAEWCIENLGILITDSHTTALRRGVTGFCLGYWGFRGLRNLVGSRDIFGRELQVTQINLADSLAASAVLMMGEGAECSPLAVLNYAPLEFSEITERTECAIPIDEDLFAPIIRPLLRPPTEAL